MVDLAKPSVDLSVSLFMEKSWTLGHLREKKYTKGKSRWKVKVKVDEITEKLLMAFKN